MQEAAGRMPGRSARIWRQHAGTTGRLAITLVSVAALLRSYIYAYAHFSSPAYFDFWFWVQDFQRWTEGHFTLHDLLKPHYGQHRIATTRLLLLLDGMAFDMNGRLAVICNMGFLAIAGTLLGALARMGGLARTRWDLPPLFWIALMSAVCQAENLIFPFQVQFAITIACACGAALLLTRAARAEGAAAIGRAAGAGALGILAAFSMASGVLLAPALFALLVLRRARPAVWAVFAPLSVLGVAAFFHHYPHAPMPPLLDAHLTLMRIAYVGNFLASALTAFPAAGPAAGLAGLALFGMAGAALLRRHWLRGEPVPAGDAALLALGLFVVECGPAATLTYRLMMGPGVAFVARYATMSLLFTAVLLALGLRWAARGARPGWWAAATLPATAAVLLVMNMPVYDDIGATWRMAATADAQLFTNNLAVEGPSPVIFLGTVDDVRDAAVFLHAKHLNMFAPENLLPDSARRGIEQGTAGLPVCRGNVDAAYGIDRGAVLLRGWAADAAGEHVARSAPWIAAVDARGQVLGAARALEARDDVRSALQAPEETDGFAAGFRVPDAEAPDPSLRILGVFPGETGLTCRLPMPVRIGPVLLEPAVELRDMAPVALAAAPALSGTVPWRPVLPGPDTKVPGGVQAWGIALPRPEAAPATLRFTLKWTPAPGRALALPFSLAAAEHGRGVTFTMADGTRLTAALTAVWNRPDWRMAVLPPDVLAQHGGPAAVEVKAAGTSWVAIGAPVAATLRPGWSRLF